ncbi:MAG: hypothetical protein M3R15_21690 [Acidobacteriota bacterium]|nr:hypothetical protein [Acidobacteriota bacterium]
MRLQRLAMFALPTWMVRAAKVIVLEIRGNAWRHVYVSSLIVTTIVPRSP